MTPLCVGVRDASVMLGVSAWTVRKWVAEGVLPAVRFPSVKYDGEKSRRVLILADDVRAFAEKHRSGVAS